MGRASYFDFPRNSGAVGLASIQVARHLGMHPIVATASSPAGLLACLEAGATVAAQHGEEGVREAERILRELGELRGDQALKFSLIVENLANVNLGVDLKNIAKRGTIVIVGSRKAICVRRLF